MAMITHERYSFFEGANECIMVSLVILFATNGHLTVRFFVSDIDAFVFAFRVQDLYIFEHKGFLHGMEMHVVKYCQGLIVNHDSVRDTDSLTITVLLDLIHVRL